MPHRIAITPGEPAGIGPDLCVAIAQHPPPEAELVVVTDGELLRQRAEQLGQSLSLNYFDPNAPTVANRPGELSILQVNLNEPVTPGELKHCKREICARHASNRNRYRNSWTMRRDGNGTCSKKHNK